MNLPFGKIEMNYREATIHDIQQIQYVRNIVKENRLSDPALVADKDVQDFITRRGRGWICEIDGIIIGFSIVDMIEKNVWALFIDPKHESKGIGKTLHGMMLDWYFNQTKETIWLSTARGTRAERFYHIAGWNEAGTHGEEVKFIMTYNQYRLMKGKGKAHRH